VSCNAVNFKTVRLPLHCVCKPAILTRPWLFILLLSTTSPQHVFIAQCYHTCLTDNALAVVERLRDPALQCKQLITSCQTMFKHSSSRSAAKTSTVIHRAVPAARARFVQAAAETAGTTERSTSHPNLTPSQLSSTVGFSQSTQPICHYCTLKPSCSKHYSERYDNCQ
jgi:hypothetical protein